MEYIVTPPVQMRTMHIQQVSRRRPLRAYLKLVHDRLQNLKRSQDTFGHDFAPLKMAHIKAYLSFAFLPIQLYVLKGLYQGQWLNPFQSGARIAPLVKSWICNL